MEEILQQQSLFLTTRENQTHVKLPFIFEKEYDSLTIYFSYTPQIVPEDVAIIAIADALPYYDVASADATDFLPLINLITVSLSYEGNYLGCHHNKRIPQFITIAETGSSLGFIPHKAQPGNWEIQLNLHCVCSNVEVQLEVRGVKVK